MKTRDVQFVYAMIAEQCPDAPSLVAVLEERVSQVQTWGPAPRGLRFGIESEEDERDVRLTGGLALVERRARALLDVKTDAHGKAGFPDASWLAVLAEEVGEVSRASSVASLRAELAQVAAVALAWIEEIDSKGDDECKSE